MMEVMARRRGMRAHENMPRRQAESLAAQGGLDHTIEGQIFGLALNTRTERGALAQAFATPPYQAPPAAPVVYVKSPNTRAASGAGVAVPAGASHLMASPTLVLVIGAPITRVSAEDVLSRLLGVVVAIDLTLPQTDYFRPAVREQCRDGFLPLCPWVTPLSEAGDLDAARIALSVNGEPRLSLDLPDLHRPIRTLISDLSDFMTFSPGDAVLCGLTAPAVAVRPGDVLVAEAPGIGRVSCTIVSEAANEAR